MLMHASDETVKFEKQIVALETKLHKKKRPT